MWRFSATVYRLVMVIVRPRAVPYAINDETVDLWCKHASKRRCTFFLTQLTWYLAPASFDALKAVERV